MHGATFGEPPSPLTLTEKTTTPATYAELACTYNLVLEINRLRRQLAVGALTWVATVHDPALYARVARGEPVPSKGAPTSTAGGGEHIAPDATGTTVGTGTPTTVAPPEEEEAALGSDNTGLLTRQLSSSGPTAPSDTPPTEGMQDTATTQASQVVGIVSPRPGEGLVAQSRALRETVVGTRGAPFVEGGSPRGIPIPGGMGGLSDGSTGVSSGVPASMSSPSAQEGSVQYDGHFNDWARFIDGTLTSPPSAERLLGGAIHEGGGAGGGDGSGVQGRGGGEGGGMGGQVDSQHVRALQAQQVRVYVWTRVYLDGVVVV